MFRMDVNTMAAPKTLGKREMSNYCKTKALYLTESITTVFINQNNKRLSNVILFWHLVPKE